MEPDQRQNRRLSPSEGRDAAVIRHKGREDVALFLNISSTGFRICTHAGFDVAIGDVVRLESTDGHHSARVTNVGTQDDKLYIGLERMHDAPLSPPGQSIRDAARKHRPDKPRIEWGMIVAYVILPLAIGLAILWMVVGPDGIRDIYQTIKRHLPG